MAWHAKHWIDMASHLEDRYVLDPSTGRWACPSAPANVVFLARVNDRPNLSPVE
jgi:hypothetical protein